MVGRVRVRRRSDEAGVLGAFALGGGFEGVCLHGDRVV
jgi:hypothetical protein